MSDIATFDEAFLRYLLAGAPQTTGTVSPYDQQAVDDAGGYLTDINKVGTQTADLQTLMALGLLEPEAYDPVVTYDPVRAPGADMLDAYAAGNPLQQLIAVELADGARGDEVTRRILEATDEDPELLKYVPRRIDFDSREMTDDPDWQTLVNDVRGIEEALLSDPEWVDVGGRRMSATEDDSPARKAALEAGYVNTPGQAYDPWSLAPEGALEQMAQAFEGMESARSNVDATQAAYERAYEGITPRQVDDPDPMNYIEGVLAQRSMPAQDGILPGVASRRSGRDDVGPAVGANARSRSRVRNAQRNENRVSNSPARRDAYAAAGRDFRQARSDQREADYAYEFAMRQDAQRQALAQELLRAGFSPFDDERRRRNAAFLG